MNKKIKLEKKDYILISFLSLALLINFFITRFVIADIEHNYYKERQISLNNVMTKIGEHINIAINQKWEKLFNLSTRVSRLSLNNTDELCDALYDIYSEQAVDFKVVDENGVAYYSDGTKQYWKDHRLVLLDKKTFLFSDMQFGSDDERVMKYITPLETPLIIGDTKITYTVLSETLDSFKNDFNTTSFGDGCLSFIIDRNGAFVYENKQNDRIQNAYNLLSYLQKNVEFVYDENYESFKYEIDNDINNTVLIRYDDKNYYMTYCSLNFEGWSAVMLVPEENLQSSNITLTQRLLFDLGILFMAIIVVFVLAFIIMWRQSVDKQKQAAHAQRQANEAKTNFLSSMSHDIRTPMNAVIGLTELALRSKEKIPNSIREDLQKIKLSSNHLLTLINDILDISKIESGKMPLNIAQFSLVDMITSLYSLLSPLAENKNINLSIQTNDIKQEYLLGDELRINQVYINLATNAMKYTPDNGNVTIKFIQESVEEDDNKLRLTYIVEDDGIGMSKQFQDVMYDSFTRATDSRVNKVAGTGLGLSICKQIINMMNGSIDCYSELSKGSTFTTILELEKGNLDEEYVVEPMHVLIVDEDDQAINNLKYCLNRLNVTYDVINYLEELDSNVHYDGAFVDLNIPINDGLAKVDRLRKIYGTDFSIILTDDKDMTECGDVVTKAKVNVTMNKPYFYRSVYEKMSIEMIKGVKLINKQEADVENILSGMRVLVAEDNDLNWEILSELLALYNVETTWVKNGQECIDILNNTKENEFVAILMDVRMPILDGRQATKIIRDSSGKWFNNIPIIAMTADAFYEDVKQCLEVGMDIHLSKPINIDKLVSILFNIANKLPLSGGGVIKL